MADGISKGIVYTYLERVFGTRPDGFGDYYQHITDDQKTASCFCSCRGERVLTIPCPPGTLSTVLASVRGVYNAPGVPEKGPITVITAAVFRAGPTRFLSGRPLPLGCGGTSFGGAFPAALKAIGKTRLVAWVHVDRYMAIREM